MLTDVHLHGALGDKYGRLHQFDIANVPQATRALAANYKGFFEDFKDGQYEVYIGDHALDEESLRLRIGRGRPVHIIPVVAGAGSGKGGVKAVAGIALLAIATGGAAAAIGPFAAGASGFSATAFSVAGFSVSYGSLALSGLTMVLQGVSALLTPTPKADYSNRERPDQRASFLFNGATNRSAEGTPVPLVYGRFRTGSVIASAGITIEQLL